MRLSAYCSIIIYFINHSKNNNNMKNEIEITIQDYGRNLEGELEIYCDILHIEDETDYDMTFDSMDEMRLWADRNNYTIKHIDYNN